MILMSKKESFWKNAHNILGVLLLVSLVGMVLFFNYFRDFFLKLVVISFLYIMFYFLDPIIFKPVGNSVRTMFSNNKFVGRLSAFPVFLFGLYFFYWLSTVLENVLLVSLSPENLVWPYVILWIAIMFAFYWYKASRED